MIENMIENTESINIILGIIVVLGVLTPICYNLQQRIDWLRRIWIYLAGTISAICLCVVVLLVIQIFASWEDQFKTPEKSQNAESERSVTPEIRVTQTRERSVNYNKVNDHCAGPKDVRWSVRAQEGWEIDVTSINVRPTSISSKSSYSGVENVTKDGFEIAGRIANNGSCIKAFGKVITKDGRGFLRVSGTYQETRQVVQEMSSD